ncbi:hypothetical protein RCH16_001566 [Cryobacterium sp. MP_M5]|uniref:hypothetical protein n=1 Tax=unclassified Cryobacterium TaxID=2649013 RepID=UPI0018CA4BF7|nr:MULTISPECIES: hypothetical protein [unclassified Cryobacterium]MBG6058198.1 hypothetical protein [Cryobacterium sp. MP_M3]MEC5176558.1 hypothetical protein [Cryobacterium sp. MP_M5]
MRRTIVILLSAALAAGGGIPPASQLAVAEEVVRPHTEVSSCPAGVTEVGTYAESELEAEYKDDLVLCDWGPQQPGTLQFTFSNNSPVVWAFRDGVERSKVPVFNTIYHEPVGIAPLFSQFAIYTGIVDNDWIVAPGETVSLASISSIGWGIAFPRITSSWLLYKQQADKLARLGKSYAAQIATTNYESKTRTFLWNCVEAGVTTRNALSSGTNADPVDFAATWLKTARADAACTKSFAELFPKKSSKLPSSVQSPRKWFDTTTKGLSKAGAFVSEIKASREWMANVTGLIRSIRP